MVAEDDTERRARLVWHAPTRLFHWALVLLVISAWSTYTFAETLRDPLLKWHRWNGLAILILVVWRILWGLVGPASARFAMFVRPPGEAVRYAGGLLRREARMFLGHNPLGAWMVLALLAAVLTQATLGLFTVEHNDITAGPLYRLLSEEGQKLASRLHRLGFYNLLLPLIGVHVCANILYGVVKREPLIRAMVTGRKPAGTYADDARLLTVSNKPGDRWPNVTALSLLALSATLVLGGIKLMGGRLI
ncbi:MAG: cytochrome b/b6 domain-containing protein [Hyphomicrobiaceae bacterium]